MAFKMARFVCRSVIGSRLYSTAVEHNMAFTFASPISVRLFNIILKN